MSSRYQLEKLTNFAESKVQRQKDFCSGFALVVQMTAFVFQCGTHFTRYDLAKKFFSIRLNLIMLLLALMLPAIVTASHVNASNMSGLVASIADT